MLSSHLGHAVGGRPAAGGAAPVLAPPPFPQRMLRRGEQLRAQGRRSTVWEAAEQEARGQECVEPPGACAGPPPGARRAWNAAAEAQYACCEHACARVRAWRRRRGAAGTGGWLERLAAGGRQAIARSAAAPHEDVGLHHTASAAPRQRSLSPAASAGAASYADAGPSGERSQAREGAPELPDRSCSRACAWGRACRRWGLTPRRRDCGGGVSVD